MTLLSIIVAKSSSTGAIGKDNALLWHISEDLKRFKSLTSGHTVIMGRKTFESIGRPLPNRRNIVISGSLKSAPEGVEIVGALSAALELCNNEEEVFIIGGGQVYRDSISIADRLYITDVDIEAEADTFFPVIDPNIWEEELREDHEGYSFINYRRKRI